jgi:hypothetical protein
MSIQAVDMMLPAVREVPARTGWAYTGGASERDLRVDFLRGVAMCSVVIVHVEIFSAFSFLAWERVGCVSSAVFFVILSGFVLGEVSRRRVEHLIAANLFPFGRSPQGPELWLNTLGHLGCLAVLWLLVQRRVFFRWIPH